MLPMPRLARPFVVAVLAAAALATAEATPAQAASRHHVLQAAARYAHAHGYHVGIAIYDTKTGRVSDAGHAHGTFASESVVKVFIATRLLIEGRMHGSTASRAYTMITRSDDAIASSLYGSVGGDSLINWVKQHYHVPDLGSPPRRAGWWGNTHITPDGLVRLYAKLKADPKVSHWLLNAMHHAKKYGSDGFYQFFGIPSATKHAAIKQGWGTDYDDWGASADQNTTGFVNNDRYAVAILARGPVRTYGHAIGAMLTHVARMVLPGGHYPDPNPVITSMSANHGSEFGGTRVTIHGTDFTHVHQVTFG
ncbi:MAG TPA: IPT/TIG domain-containing protein, partial [Micromonosporaceae bacterium]